MRRLRWIVILFMIGIVAQADNDIYGADGSYKGEVEK